jgi:hypothetical protein
MTNLYFKPALDAAGEPIHVRDPQTHLPLRAEGEWKELSVYWSRRLRDGEVIEASPPAVAPSKPAPSALAKPICSACALQPDGSYLCKGAPCPGAPAAPAS